MDKFDKSLSNLVILFIYFAYLFKKGEEKLGSGRMTNVFVENQQQILRVHFVVFFTNQTGTNLFIFGDLDESLKDDIGNLGK